MLMAREFFSDFMKSKRTPMVPLHVCLPLAVSLLFWSYYTLAGWRIIPDPRWFFVLLEISWPAFAGIAVPIFLQPEQRNGREQKLLGLAESRIGTYLGKLCFLLFFSAVSMIIYVGCFLVWAWIYPKQGIGYEGSAMDVSFCLKILGICLSHSLFFYVLHLPVTLRFGSGVSVLLGMGGTILAGLLENPICDKIWIFLPWEWGVRFFKSYFGFSREPVFLGSIVMIMITLAVLSLSLYWFAKWEGKTVQE